MRVRDVLVTFGDLPEDVLSMEWVGCFLQAPGELGLIVRPTPGSESVAYVRGADTGLQWEPLVVPPSEPEA